MSPTYGCPFCGHALDKLHRVQSTTACWVECSRCHARGPAADTVDEAVKAWGRWATVGLRVSARQETDRQHAAGTLRADIESTPLPSEPGFRDDTKALARLMLATVDAEPELLQVPRLPRYDAIMSATRRRYPEYAEWLKTPSGFMIGTAIRAVLRVHLIDPDDPQEPTP